MWLWMISLLRSKWLPLLAILLAISIGAAWLNHASYRKGVMDTEARMAHEYNLKLQAEIEKINRLAKIDQAATVRQMVREARVRNHVESIQIPEWPSIECPPVTGLPVAGDHPPEPDYSEWLRFFNAAVRAPTPTNP